MDARQNFILKLENVREVFQEIRDKDKRRLIIRQNERSVFDRLTRSAENLLKKLKRNEFTVAVVGLEKAGKSTLINALLNLIVLPEYTERCTYTTTEIRSGTTSSAEVYFYAREKFNDNFKQMLRNIEYPEVTTFEELDTETLLRYWRGVKESNAALFQQHNGTTIEDLKAILQEKDTFDYLLGKSPEILDINDGDDREKLYRYITGIDQYSGGHVERTAEPYAVEKVVIKSNELADMGNVIFYDVPGFDSPTELHKRQTEEMLKQADAIILVTNVGDRPNLTGTQLDMLQKGRDDDGVTLADKVFVFGNKLDMAGNARLAQDNSAALIHDAADKYAIAQRNRIVCGSAKAYLERQNKLSQDDVKRGLRNISATLDGWGISDGIADIKAKMQYYYEHDRFEILKKRAEKNITDVKTFLLEVLSRYDSQDGEVEGGEKYLLQAKDALSTFSKRAVAVGRECCQQVAEELPFTALIRDNITEIFPSESADSVHLKNAENAGNAGEGYALSRVDAFLRSELNFAFQKNLITRTANATLAKEDEFYRRLTSELLDSLNAEENSPYRAELEESTKNLFKSLLIKNGEHCYFNPLIERYSGALIEATIKSPYASAERLQKLVGEDTQNDFQSLAIYFRDDVAEDEYLSAEDRQKFFFAKILTHEDITSPNAEDNEIALRKFFDKYRDNLAAGFDFEQLPFKVWSSLLAKLGVNVAESDLLARLKKALIQFVGVAAWSKMSAQEKNRQLDSAIIVYCSELPPATLTEYVKNLAAEIRGVESKDEMLRVLNEDIDILREFTLKALVRAMNLEGAFNSVMLKNIDLIRNSMDHSEDGKKIFNQWLKSNMRKIRVSDYLAIEESIDSFQKQKAVAESIRLTLSKLDN